MSNVIPFPSRTVTIDGYEMERELVSVDFVSDLFKAHFTAMLCPELGIDSEDAEVLDYLYKKYSEKFEEYME